MNDQLSAQYWIEALTCGGDFPNLAAFPFDSFASSDMVADAFEAAAVEFSFEILDMRVPLRPEGWAYGDAIFDQVPLSSILQFLDYTQLFYSAFDADILPVFRESLSQNILFGGFIMAGLFGDEYIDFSNFESDGRRILERESEKRQIVAQAHLYFRQQVKKTPDLVRHFVGALMPTKTRTVPHDSRERVISEPDWHYSCLHRLLTKGLSPDVQECEDDLVQDLTHGAFCAATRVLAEAKDRSEDPLIALLRWLESETHQVDISYWPNAMASKVKDEYRKRGVRFKAHANFKASINHFSHSTNSNPTELIPQWPSKSREMQMAREIKDLIGERTGLVFLTKLRQIFLGTKDLADKDLAEGIGMKPASFSEYRTKYQRDIDKHEEVELICQKYLY